ncbi:MAG: (2Fe-2S)-binding protein [Cytophagaceae bacterium]|nr:(2Fe-2S)-binding protein [Cytophagaceae bacterium]MBL0300839.1 (2Fe-2S)-binding protein [Cytophagaceae bacterium]
MEATQLIKVTVDGKTVEVPVGTTIMEAARMIGPEVAPPAMCYYKPLKGSGGKCRACLVKVAQGSEKDPRPMPKLVASCITQAQDGMVVENFSNPDVVNARKGIVEFLLINHPLDCPVCDQAGECHLQDFAFEHGLGTTRYDDERRTFEPEDIGDKIQLNKNRCILCYRCVYTAEQITDSRVHGVMYRGDHAEISTYISKAIDNDFSGNVIDVCPVGALTDKTYRFKSRVWFSKPADAHCDCDKCSGKVNLWYKGDEVIRVTARKNQWGEVEDFICNDCRYEKKKTSDWAIEGPTKIPRHSVISANKYAANTIKKPEFAMDFAAHNFKEIDDNRDYNKSLEEIKKSGDYKNLMNKNKALLSK